MPNTDALFNEWRFDFSEFLLKQQTPLELSTVSNTLLLVSPVSPVYKLTVLIVLRCLSLEDISQSISISIFK